MSESECIMENFQEAIFKCRECAIRKYQPPLVDTLPAGSNIIMLVDFAAPLVPNAIVSKPYSTFPAKEMLEPFIKKWQPRGYEFYHAYMCKCPPLSNGVHRKPYKHELQICFYHLQTEIRTLKPKAVFLMGNQTYLTLLSFLRIPFRKWKGFYFDIYQHNKTPYVPVTHPELIVKNNTKNYDIYFDGLNNVLERCL